MSEENPQMAATQAAIQLLTRREYAAKELADKLAQKGHQRAIIAEVISELQDKGYQSEARYCEMFVRTRVHQHYGPTNISQ